MTDKIDVLVLRQRDRKNGWTTIETVAMSPTGTPFRIHGVKAQRVIDKKGRAGIVLLPSRRWLCLPRGETTRSFLAKLSQPAYRTSIARAADPITSLTDLRKVAHRTNTLILADQAIAAILTGEDSAGFCLKCGEKHTGIEPDAEDHKCESCGTRTVMGAERIIQTAGE